MIKYNSFQDFITNCKDDIDRLDYWDDLKKLNPDKSYFANEPDWGDMPLWRRSYIVAKVHHLFPQAYNKWMSNKKFILDDPYFPHGITDGRLRLLLMIESPPEFKSRNIFISANGCNRV